MMPASPPRVVLIGRTNVGKSTLFNRLTQSGRALVSILAGTTRDAKEAPVLWRGNSFLLVDTGGMDITSADEQLATRVIATAKKTLNNSSIILMIIDGQAGITASDRKILKEISKIKTPKILVINKIDNERTELAALNEISTYGNWPIFYVSALNGRSTGELLDAIYQQLGEIAPVMAQNVTRVAIVGRPNVGKSTLLNAILGEEKVIVADLPHTTRDTNDILYEYKSEKFLLIDTAGIRRQARVGKGQSKLVGMIEKNSVIASLEAIKRADVVLVVIEASRRVTSQDKSILNFAKIHGKGLIIVVNKWDLIEEKNPLTIDKFRDYFDAALPFIRYAPIIFISAMQNLRTHAVLDLVLRVSYNYQRRLSPEELIPLLTRLPRGTKKRLDRFGKLPSPFVYHNLTQIASSPPTFLLAANRPKELPAAVYHILEKELRKTFDFEGVKINIETNKK